MTQEEKAKAYDEAVDYAKRSLSRLSEDYRCEILTKDGIRYNYSKLFPGEEEFRTDSNEWLKMKLIVGLESLLKQGKETFAGADIEAMIEYLKKPNTPKLFNDEKYQVVETVVSLEAGGFPVIEFGVKRFGLKVGDKVRVIISPKED